MTISKRFCFCKSDPIGLEEEVPHGLEPAPTGAARGAGDARAAAAAEEGAAEGAWG